MPAPQAVLAKIDQFHNDPRRRLSSYNETEVRVHYINPLFEALGWDVTNALGRAEVKHEDRVDVRERDRLRAKAPDYGFYLDGRRRFFVEAKKPAVNLARDPAPAHQLRRYAWTAKLPLSILTDFEELAVYDTRVRLRPDDSAAVARLRFWRYDDYPAAWDEIAALLGRDAVLAGSLERFVEVEGGRKGIATVDAEFLRQLDEWRDVLARAVANRNRLSQRDLNFAVQQILDRIIFLRIAEDRGIEPYGQLQDLAQGAGTYQRLFGLWARADARYNSGLFHFQHERPHDTPDMVTPGLTIDDRPLKDILRALYPPASPYAFEVFPADILGQVYEQFLGKVIRLTDGGHAKVEEKPEVRKAGGVYYTPTYIVEYIVRQTVGRLLEGHTPDPRGPAGRLRVLDPACGSGSFLLGAYQYLLDWHLAGYVADAKKWSKGRAATLHQRADGSYALRLAERRRILLDNLYGVDIDAQAVEVTKLSLLLKVLEGAAEQLGPQAALLGERVLPDLDRNVKCGNSLIGPDFYNRPQPALLADDELLRVNAFDWQTEFRDIMSNGGFDAVIGNPPYIRIQTLQEWAPLEVEYYKKLYKSASKGNYDIYVAFVENGMNLLKKGGRLAYIMPQKFYQVQYGEPLRDLLSIGRNVERIVNFAHNQVFVGAFVNTCILVVSKEAAETVTYVPVHKTASPSLISEALDSAPEIDLPSTVITKAPWVLQQRSSADLLNKLAAAGTPLVELTARIFQGLKTGGDKVFVFELVAETPQTFIVRSKQLDREVELERKICRYLIKGTEMRPYFPKEVIRVILFPYEAVSGKPQLVNERDLRNDFPLAFSYLKENERFLRSREHSKMNDSSWYAYTRNQALDVISEPKIITPDLALRSSFLPDAKGDLFFLGGAAGGYGIVPKPSVDNVYLLGLLNSKLLSYFITRSGQQMESGYYSFEARFIRSVPIRPIDPTNPTDAALHDRMVALVQQMLDLHRRLPAEANPQMKTMLQRRIDATDREIDRLVYELYGLTEEEVGIVEGG